MKISLIIAYYKNIDALKIILTALEKQSYKNYEVIIAEDDNDYKTIEFVKSIKSKFYFELINLHQEFDNGFRKNEMLNKAITKASGEIIVFLDGDSIPHKHFLLQYSMNISKGIACFGRRVMLGEKLTNKIMQSRSLVNLKLTHILLSDSKRLKYGLYIPFIKSLRETGIWGCNWGILKQHLLEINGFDEDYIKAGVGEDVDIEWRLKQNGIKLLSIRFGAIVYHLHHKVNYSGEDVKHNFNLFEKKKNGKHIYCVNGLIKNNH